MICWHSYPRLPARVAVARGRIRAIRFSDLSARQANSASGSWLLHIRSPLFNLRPPAPRELLELPKIQKTPDEPRMHIRLVSGPVPTSTPEIGVIRPPAFGVPPTSPAIDLVSGGSSLRRSNGCSVFEMLAGDGGLADLGGCFQGDRERCFVWKNSCDPWWPFPVYFVGARSLGLTRATVYTGSGAGASSCMLLLDWAIWNREEDSGVSCCYGMEDPGLGRVVSEIGVRSVLLLPLACFWTEWYFFLRIGVVYCAWLRYRVSTGARWSGLCCSGKKKF